jgi:hypothetical protein
VMVHDAAPLLLIWRWTGIPTPEATYQVQMMNKIVRYAVLRMTA